MKTKPCLFLILVQVETCYSDPAELFTAAFNDVTAPQVKELLRLSVDPSTDGRRTMMIFPDLLTVSPEFLKPELTATECCGTNDTVQAHLESGSHHCGFTSS